MMNELAISKHTRTALAYNTYLIIIFISFYFTEGPGERALIQYSNLLLTFQEAFGGGGVEKNRRPHLISVVVIGTGTQWRCHHLLVWFGIGVRNESTRVKCT
jgi:hypothetical protein